MLEELLKELSETLGLVKGLIFLRIRRSGTLDHIRRWNIWRKRCLNGPIHKILVLFGVIESPTMVYILLPEEEEKLRKDLIKAFGSDPFMKGEN